MRLNLTIKILVVAIVLISATVGYVRYYKTGAIEKGSSMPVVFQPDSQILNQAIDPGGVSGSTVTIDDTVCQSSPSTYICFSAYYKGLVKDVGVVQATADLKKRSEDNAGVLAQCHPLIHVIGRQAAGNFETISEAFANGDSFCWSGYYHGIMESMIAEIGLENLSGELNNICADIPGKENYTFDYFNCVHGLGHGIMALLEDEVFDSLSMCENLGGFWEQESCYSGVFMQNIIDSTNVADTGGKVKYLKPAEPLYPCTVVEDRYKGQCYLGQTSYALQVTGYDYKKVFGLCTTLENPYRDICNQSMGRDVANQAHHEKNLTKEMCSWAADPKDRSNCIIGAAKEIISYYHSDKEALEFCNVLSGEDKKTCTNTTHSYYSNF